MLQQNSSATDVNHNKRLEPKFETETFSILGYTSVSAKLNANLIWFLMLKEFIYLCSHFVINQKTVEIDLHDFPLFG